ncbi:hypothetical protein U1Q18_004654, partial [Sarracenia purpurea var. burkii]
ALHNDNDDLSMNRLRFSSIDYRILHYSSLLRAEQSFKTGAISIAWNEMGPTDKKELVWNLSINGFPK